MGNVGKNRLAGHLLPARVMLLTALVTFCVEFFIMVVFGDFVSSSPLQYAALDAICLVSILVPALYFLIYVPFYLPFYLQIKERDQMRKSAEQENLRLRAAIEQSGEAMVMTDAAANILYVNAAFEKITGYSRDEAVGKNPGILKSGRQDAEFYQKMWGVLTSGRTWHGRLVNKKKDGTLFEETATISPVVDVSGKITNYVAVKRDVTEEAMLSRAKDYFTRVTSHEMNTPLSKLILVGTLLKEHGSPDSWKLEKARTVLEDAYASFGRISSATSLLSSLQLNDIITPLPLILKPILSVVVETARELASKAGRNVNIKEMSGLSLDTKVLCEQRMIMQMLQEIVSNAVKYTPDGKDVTVSARQEAEFAVVEISDKGPGIPIELREAVFQPFFSLENPLQHSTGEYSFKGGGIGLGLTLAKMIANFHKGSISLSSDENGSTFTLRLPSQKNNFVPNHVGWRNVGSKCT